jgi:serine/threonine protein kinase
LGDIKPENVFVNDEGEIKVANIFTWPHERPSYWKFLEDEKNFNGYLAPEDMALLQSNSLDNDANEQSEIFAIGATILSSAILDNLHEVYNFKEKSISLVHLKEKKRIFVENSRYSPIFKATIMNLLSVSPSERVTVHELSEFVAPYRESILSKKQFVIQSAPKKVEYTLQGFQKNIY